MAHYYRVHVSKAMNKTDFQTAILREAEKRGFNPSSLTHAQYTMLGIQVRSVREKIEAGAKAVISRTKTSLGISVVLPVIAASNESICRTNKCGKFRTLKNGEPACDACTCSANMLKSKWRDASQSCALPEPIVGQSDGPVISR